METLSWFFCKFVKLKSHNYYTEYAIQASSLDEAKAKITQMFTPHWVFTVEPISQEDVDSWRKSKGKGFSFKKGGLNQKTSSELNKEPRKPKVSGNPQLDSGFIDIYKPLRGKVQE